MVSHDAESIEVYLIFLYCVLKRFDEVFFVLIFRKYMFPSVAPRYDVIYRSFILYPQRSCHEMHYKEPALVCQASRADPFCSFLRTLKKNIDSNYPVIVLVDYGISLYQVNHFMVGLGYNEHGVIVNSGRNKHKFISEKDFTKVWEKTNYWTLLIKPNQ